MGDTPDSDILLNESDVNANAKFSAKAAADAFNIARLPHLYEKALNDSDIASNAVKNDVPDNIDSYNFIKINATTAIITYSPAEHRATVSFDPTHTIGDKWDNLQRGEEEHSLGGNVHGGIYDDLVSEQDAPNFPDGSMSDLVQGILHDYASKNPERALDVDFSGFSKGGGQSALMAGELISDDFFEDNPNINLGQIYTFGSPGYGDEKFTQQLDNRVQELGGQMWEVQIHGDQTPDILTPEGSGLFTRYDYGQAGEKVYIVPGQDGSAPYHLMNPSKTDIDALGQTEPNVSMHNMDIYDEILNKLSVAEEGTAPSYDASSQTPIVSQPMNGL